MSQFVYVLELEGGCYYVGTSSDPQARLRRHMGGRTAGAAAWTAAHRPIRFLRQPIGPLTELQALSVEEATTLEMMNLHGVPKVRGAHWSKVILSPEDFRAAAHRSITCLGCGFRGHTLATCPGAALAPVAAAEPPRITPAPVHRKLGTERERSPERNNGSTHIRLVKTSSTNYICYVYSHSDGKKKIEESPRTAPARARSTSKPKRERSRARDDSDACFRCGRDSHWVEDCYARTHADGTRLSDDDDSDEESDDDDSADDRRKRKRRNNGRGR